MQTNLFPAILIAGPPNCGKSVLSYLLTQHLSNLGVPHYLLRAAPDGEGNWFMQGSWPLVRTLRLRHKSAYTAQFVAHVRNAIQARLLPLLVDVGGLPQGEQFGILGACTHAVLLYCSAEQKIAWQETLERLNVPLIAALRSSLSEPGQILETYPILAGSISGLQRQEPRTDLTFGALLDRIAGLCHYEPLQLEQAHLRAAPFQPLLERRLMAAIDAERSGVRSVWQFTDLPGVQELVPPDQPAALYGPGPVWLAAMLAAHLHRVACAIFDARYGWLPVIEPRTGNSPELRVSISPFEGGEGSLPASWIDLDAPGSILEPEDFCLPAFTSREGVILSGKLPRWAYACLAHQMAPDKTWIGIYAPTLHGAVVVQSKAPSPKLGEFVKGAPAAQLPK